LKVEAGVILELQAFDGSWRISPFPSSVRRKQEEVVVDVRGAAVGTIVGDAAIAVATANERRSLVGKSTIRPS
jgi:hypothetical protein